MPIATLNEAIKKVGKRVLSDINTCLPGRIESYNFEKQKASVKPLIKRQYKDGVILQRPVIVEVPVIFPRSREGSFTFPLAKGDFVLLLFSQRALDRFLNTGRDSEPGDFRKFDLTDGIALPGLYPFTEDSLAENNEDMLLVFKDNKMRITEDGNFEFEVSKDLKIQVSKNQEISISGDSKIDIDGSSNINITGDLTGDVGGEASLDIGSSANITAGGNVNITADNVHITGNLTVSGTTDLAGGGPGIAREGDSVETTITIPSGSSAGVYSGSGTITSASNKSTSN